MKSGLYLRATSALLLAYFVYRLVAAYIAATLLQFGQVSTSAFWLVLLAPLLGYCQWRFSKRFQVRTHTIFVLLFLVLLYAGPLPWLRNFGLAPDSVPPRDVDSPISLDAPGRYSCSSYEHPYPDLEVDFGQTFDDWPCQWVVLPDFKIRRVAQLGWNPSTGRCFEFELADGKEEEELIACRKHTDEIEEVSFAFQNKNYVMEPQAPLECYGPSMIGRGKVIWRADRFSKSMRMDEYRRRHTECRGFKGR